MRRIFVVGFLGEFSKCNRRLFSCQFCIRISKENEHCIIYYWLCNLFWHINADNFCCNRLVYRYVLSILLKYIKLCHRYGFRLLSISFNCCSFRLLSVSFFYLNFLLVFVFVFFLTKILIGVFRTLSNIFDSALLPRQCTVFGLFIFTRKLQHRSAMFDRLLNTSLILDLDQEILPKV